MNDLTFAQPARRNFLIPILVALLVLGIAVFFVLRFTPHTTADAAVTATQTFATHTVYKSDSIVVNRDQVQDDLYVLATVTVTDRLRLPLFLKDYTATFTPAEGEPITTSAVEKHDFAAIFLSYPTLKVMVDAAPAPLDRDTRIAPGQTASGTILLHFPINQADWDHRKSAALNIDLYHQQPFSIPIPPATNH